VIVDAVVRVQERIDAPHPQPYLQAATQPCVCRPTTLLATYEPCVVRGCAQERIDATCACLAMAFLHLLVVHTSQVMVVALNFEAHTSGNLVDIEYRWNWYFADMFHFGTGFLLMFSGLMCAVMVTETGKQVIKDVLNHARKKGIRSVNRATLHSNMEGQLTGYTLAWGVSVTGEFVVMFFWAEVLTLYECFANAFQEY